MAKSSKKRKEVIIYLLTEIATDLKYVGQSANLKERYDLGYTKCKRLQAVIDEYKIKYNLYYDADVLNKYFKRTILAAIYADCDNNAADMLEEYYIDLYNTRDPLCGFNILHGGKKTYNEMRNHQKISSILNVKTYTTLSDNTKLSKDPLFNKRVKVLHIDRRNTPHSYTRPSFHNFIEHAPRAAKVLTYAYVKEHIQNNVVTAQVGRSKYTVRFI